MDLREKDIRKLCNDVINMSVVVHWNDGYNTSACPFCSSIVFHDNGTMDTLKHDLDCPYLMAKDLMTNVQI